MFVGLFPWKKSSSAVTGVIKLSYRSGGGGDEMLNLKIAHM